MKIVVVGAGAAGFFGAIVAKSLKREAEVLLLEKTRQPLAKVKVSGGGRCNVTHCCFDASQLLKGYPRGAKELLGAFHRFQPQGMVRWLEERGVDLKAESDGRMFPVTDSSQTIIDCFRLEAQNLGVKILLNADVMSIQPERVWKVILGSSEVIEADKILIATGSSQKAYNWIQELGHTIKAPVPSLFTFTIDDVSLEGLSGISVNDVVVGVLGFEQRGPLLITHWGLSGPAILKLSAWAARELSSVCYQTDLTVCWLPQYTPESLRALLNEKRRTSARQQISAEPLGGLPRKLWAKLIEAAGIGKNRLFAQLSKQEVEQLLAVLLKRSFATKGKSTNKEEFVTCGGVALEEIDFRRMESRKHPGLHFAGEVLDIDGITGGFNFQNAWTTAWIAAHAIAEG